MKDISEAARLSDRSICIENQYTRGIIQPGTYSKVNEVLLHIHSARLNDPFLPNLAILYNIIEYVPEIVQCLGDYFVYRC